MVEKRRENLSLTYHPVTPDRWVDLERLFGKYGACSGCWCMWWRLSRAQFSKQTGDEKRIALKRIVNSGEVPGILAYDEGEPVAWCSVAPRESYGSLERSRVLKRIDDKPVWSVVCFFVAKPYRNMGVTAGLLRAAIEHVRASGGTLIEGYPVDSGRGRMPDPFVYPGLPSTFLKAGFSEVLRRSKSRPIMRYAITMT